MFRLLSFLLLDIQDDTLYVEQNKKIVVVRDNTAISLLQEKT